MYVPWIESCSIFKATFLNVRQKWFKVYCLKRILLRLFLHIIDYIWNVTPQSRINGDDSNIKLSLNFADFLVHSQVLLPVISSVLFIGTFSAFYEISTFIVNSMLLSQTFFQLQIINITMNFLITLPISKRTQFHKNWPLIIELRL